MKSAIKEMMYGNKGSLEKINFSDKFKKTPKNYLKLEEQLIQMLPCEALEIYENVIALMLEMHIKEIELIYEEGFSFGLLLGVESCKNLK